jgi:hypothetical protein
MAEFVANGFSVNEFWHLTPATTGALLKRFTQQELYKQETLKAQLIALSRRR